MLGIPHFTCEMATLSVHQQVKRYGLPKSGCKTVLTKRIAEACAPAWIKQVHQAVQTVRFQALWGDTENPHKAVQHW